MLTVLDIIQDTRRGVFLRFQVREAYKTYMKKVAKLLGGGADSDTQMMKVFALENTLATVNEFFYRVRKCNLVVGSIIHELIIIYLEWLFGVNSSI